MIYMSGVTHSRVCCYRRINVQALSTLFWYSSVVWHVIKLIPWRSTNQHKVSFINEWQLTHFVECPRDKFIPALNYIIAVIELFPHQSLSLSLSLQSKACHFIMKTGGITKTWRCYPYVFTFLINITFISTFTIILRLCGVCGAQVTMLLKKQ